MRRCRSCTSVTDPTRVATKIPPTPYRAAEWRHKAVELAAHDLLQRLDKKSG